MNILADALLQIFEMALFFSINMQGILGLNCWLEDFLCKTTLRCLSFEGEYLFGRVLDKYIKEITGVRVLYSLRKKDLRFMSRPSTLKAWESSIHSLQASSSKVESGTIFHPEM